LRICTGLENFGAERIGLQVLNWAGFGKKSRREGIFLRRNSIFLKKFCNQIIKRKFLCITSVLKRGVWLYLIVIIAKFLKNSTICTEKYN